MPNPRAIYGGQAVIEGVMIRGQRFFSLAVRRLDGTIYRKAEPLSSVYTGRLRRIPLLRGVVILAETLILGMKVLTRSANIAMEDQTQGEQKELGGWVLFLSLGVSMLIGVGIFFLMPLFRRPFSRHLDRARAAGRLHQQLPGRPAATGPVSGLYLADWVDEGHPAGLRLSRGRST